MSFAQITCINLCLPKNTVDTTDRMTTSTNRFIFFYAGFQFLKSEQWTFVNWLTFCKPLWPFWCRPPDKVATLLTIVYCMPFKFFISWENRKNQNHTALKARDCGIRTDGEEAGHHRSRPGEIRISSRHCRSVSIFLHFSHASVSLFLRNLRNYFFTTVSFSYSHDPLNWKLQCSCTIPVYGRSQGPKWFGKKPSGCVKSGLPNSVRWHRRSNGFAAICNCVFFWVERERGLTFKSPLTLNARNRLTQWVVFTNSI